MQSCFSLWSHTMCCSVWVALPFCCLQGWLLVLNAAFSERDSPTVLCRLIYLYPYKVGLLYYFSPWRSSPFVQEKKIYYFCIWYLSIQSRKQGWLVWFTESQAFKVITEQCSKEASVPLKALPGIFMTVNNFSSFPFFCLHWLWRPSPPFPKLTSLTSGEQ